MKYITSGNTSMCKTYESFNKLHVLLIVQLYHIMNIRSGGNVEIKSLINNQGSSFLQTLFWLRWNTHRHVCRDDWNRNNAEKNGTLDFLAGKCDVIVICSWSSLHTPTQAGAGNQTSPQEPSYSGLIWLLCPSCSAPLLPVPASTVIHMLLTEVKGSVSGGFHTDRLLSRRLPRRYAIMDVDGISCILLTTLKNCF